MLAPNLDIAANIFLGNEAQTPRLLAPLRTVDLQRKTAALLERVGLRVPAGTTRLDAQRRPDADGRDRQGAVARRPHHRHGRADVVAHGRANRRTCSRSSGSCATRASASSTSRTAWKRCSTWPIASPCCVTAAASATSSGATRPTKQIVAMMVGRELSRPLFPGSPRRVQAARCVRRRRISWFRGRRRPVASPCDAGEILGFAGLDGRRAHGADADDLRRHAGPRAAR